MTDLKSMTRKELEKLKANIEKALAKLDAKDKKAALAAAEKAAAAHGFSLAELAGVPQQRKAKKAAKKAGIAKYKNPADATQTWTGKGRQPQGFKDALASGKTPESMEL